MFDVASQMKTSNQRKGTISCFGKVELISGRVGCRKGANLVSRASQVSEAWLREAGQSQYPEGLMGFCFVSR